MGGITPHPRIADFARREQRALLAVEDARHRAYLDALTALATLNVFINDQEKGEGAVALHALLTTTRETIRDYYMGRLFVPGTKDHSS